MPDLTLPFPTTKRGAVLRGIRDAFGVPLAVLMVTFTGYVGLAREAGFDLPQILAMTLFIWALPAQVVLLTAVTAGVTLPAAALAVGLSGVRLMPMVVSLLPEVRAAGTRRLTLIVIALFTAVTSWVIGMERLSQVPRALRTRWFLGVQLTLVGTNLLLCVVVFIATANLPPAISAALAFVMPIYFLASIWASARERASLVALAAGLVVAPLVHPLAPDLDLLAAGLVGGGLGWAWHLREARR